MALPNTSPWCGLELFNVSRQNWSIADDGIRHLQKKNSSALSLYRLFFLGISERLLSQFFHQWHPGTAATTTSPKLRLNGAQQWHPVMAPRNGSSNGTQERQLRQPRQTSDPPMAAMTPRNGSYDNLAKVASQWHKAMAPRNGSSAGTRRNGSYTTTSPKV